MGDSTKAAIAPEQFKTPRLKRLARIYRDSLDNGDRELAGAAEAAAMEVAAAEASLSEAVALTLFVDDAAV